MKRVAVNSLTALSLAFFIAVVLVWARSYIAYDSIVWTRVDGPRITRDSLVSCWWRVEFQVHTAQFAGEEINTDWYIHDLYRSEAGFRWKTGPVSTGYRIRNSLVEKIGFAVGRTYSEPTRPPGKVDHVFTVELPDWLLALLTMILPIRWMRAVMCVRNRRRLGLCLHCGYNLKGSLDSCPECGTAFGRTHGRVEVQRALYHRPPHIEGSHTNQEPPNQ